MGIDSKSIRRLSALSLVGLGFAFSLLLCAQVQTVVPPVIRKRKTGGGSRKDPPRWRASWKGTTLIAAPLFLIRQKKSWVDSGSGNLPSE
jgi:hypothetical protein